MLRSIKSPQRLPRLISAIIESDGTVAVGSHDVSVVLAGSVYTVTLAAGFHRVPIVSVSPTEAGMLVVSAATASSVEITALAVDGATPQDTGFHIQILGFDAADEY